eukprot:GEMP01022797.1.p1 GENE.GEMP01022797.1~~GEMP01022797.1.p1  ORF type:complete len:422 (+),score=69.86 GEMP01022797.1:179-1444(+)
MCRNDERTLLPSGAIKWRCQEPKHSELLSAWSRSPSPIYMRTPIIRKPQENGDPLATSTTASSSSTIAASPDGTQPRCETEYTLVQLHSPPYYSKPRHSIEEVRSPHSCTRVRATPAPVSVRWMNGSDEELPPSRFLGEIRVHICRKYGYLWHDIILMDMNYDVITDDCGQAMDMAVVILEQPTQDEKVWENTLRMHSLYEQPTLVRKSMDRMKDDGVRYNYIMNRVWGAMSDEFVIYRTILAANLDNFDVNDVDRLTFGMTALHKCAEKGAAETALWLLKANANAASHGSLNTTPLHKASMAGHCNVIEVLLQYGADINVELEYFETTPLHCAAERGRVEALKMLLAAGADITAYNYMGETPMDLAEKEGRTAAMEVLQEAQSKKRFLWIACAKSQYHHVKRQFVNCLSPMLRSTSLFYN